MFWLSVRWCCAPQSLLHTDNLHTITKTHTGTYTQTHTHTHSTLRGQVIMKKKPTRVHLEHLTFKSTVRLIRFTTFSALIIFILANFAH